MKISATGSGGFSGAAEHYDIDTSRLEHGAQLEALLRKLDFFTAPAPPLPLGADLLHWEITVDDGTRRHTVAFAEDGSAAAAPWQSLIARLRSTA